jgi:hypothetical protein
LGQKGLKRSKTGAKKGAKTGAKRPKKPKKEQKQVQKGLIRSKTASTDGGHDVPPYLQPMRIDLAQQHRM